MLYRYQQHLQFTFWAYQTCRKNNCPELSWSIRDSEVPGSTGFTITAVDSQLRCGVDRLGSNRWWELRLKRKECRTDDKKGA